MAVAVGRLPREIMREPYAHTLWMFYQLEEHTRIDQYAERARSLDLAGLVACAFHEPKKLSDANQQLLDDAGLTPSVDDALAKAEETIAAMKQLDAIGAAGLPAHTGSAC